MERLPTLVFWLGEFNSMDCIVHGVTELDTTEQLSLLPQNSEKVGFKSPRKHFFPVSQDFMLGSVTGVVMINQGWKSHLYEAFK